MLKLILLDAKSTGRHETFRVDDDEVEVIGRKASRLRTPDTRVSRAHAEVRVRNGVWIIRDLGSANGTLVNNRVIDGLCEIKEDDVIQVGRATLIVAVARVEAAAAEMTAVAGPDDTAAAGGLLDDARPAGDHADGDTLSDHDDTLELEPAPPPVNAAAGFHEPERPVSVAGPLDDPASDEASAPDLPPDAVDRDDDEDQEDEEEPADPESTGLRLANYDVLDDDELAEVLAADAPPAIPVADTPVEIVFPDPDGAAHPGDEELLLDVDPGAAPGLDAGPDVTGFEPLEAHHAPPDPPRHAVASSASADSRLITPAPESALGTRHHAPGFPWRGTAAAVLTLAAAGTGAFLLSRGGVAGPLTPVTGTPAATPAAAVNRDPSPVAVTTRLPARRGQPSPFDAGPVLTARITPRKPAPVIPTPRVEPATLKPETPRAEPSPKPDPAPAVAVAPKPTPAPAVPTPTEESANLTPPAPAPTPVEAASATPPPTAGPSPAAALVPTGTRPVPTPPLVAPLLPDIAPEIDTAPAAPVSAPISAPVSAPLAAPRRVVYVVDASGSMVDSMNQGVLTWLETQIGNLRPTDAFSVIFFHDAEVLETPPAGLMPGRRAEQVKALDWMAPESGNMRPRGRSRPLAALRLAASYSATEVVLLTDDNFGLRSGEDVSPQAIAEVLRPADTDAAMPTVHAVQFFYEDSEGRLKAIASLFGGRYQFVEEPPFDARPVLDDLLDG